MPQKDPKEAVSVCALRALGGFAKYSGDVVTVTGEVDANAEFTLLSGKVCDRGVMLKFGVPTPNSDSERFSRFRSAVESKIGCYEDRPLEVELSGKLDMQSNTYGNFYTFTVVDVRKVDFGEGRSRTCVPSTSTPQAPSRNAFPEPYDVDGRVVAFHWPSHVFPGFENIHIEHFVVQLNDRTAVGAEPRFIRVDFWGAPHLDDYRLPDAVYEQGHLWRWHLVPLSMASVEDELCTDDVQQTMSFVDISGKEIRRETAFKVLAAAPDLPAFATLPCYVVKKAGLSLIR